MKWFKALFQTKQAHTAHIAKERLQVIVAHERVQRNGPDFLPMLQKEITAVIAKYVDIGPDEVTVDFEQQGDRSVLELNIMLPERFLEKAREEQKTRSKSINQTTM